MDESVKEIEEITRQRLCLQSRAAFHHVRYDALLRDYGIDQL